MRRLGKGRRMEEIEKILFQTSLFN